MEAVVIFLNIVLLVVVNDYPFVYLITIPRRFDGGDQ